MVTIKPKGRNQEIEWPATLRCVKVPSHVWKDAICPKSAVERGGLLFVEGRWFEDPVIVTLGDTKVGDLVFVEDGQDNIWRPYEVTEVDAGD